MKTTSLTFLTLILFVFSLFYSCADNPPGLPPIVDAVTLTPPSTIDTIAIDRYTRWVNNWKNHGAGFTDTMLIKSFTVPQIDLVEVFGETPKPHQARFIHGLDMSSLPYTAHLLVVGVNARGQSMIDYANGHYVYDFACPCPKTCGKVCN